MAEKETFRKRVSKEVRSFAPQLVGVTLSLALLLGISEALRQASRPQSIGEQYSVDSPIATRIVVLPDGRAYPDRITDVIFIKPNSLEENFNPVPGAETFNLPQPNDSLYYLRPAGILHFTTCMTPPEASIPNCWVAEIQGFDNRDNKPFGPDTIAVDWSGYSTIAATFNNQPLAITRVSRVIQITPSG